MNINDLINMIEAHGCVVTRYTEYALYVRDPWSGVDDIIPASKRAVRAWLGY